MAKSIYSSKASRRALSNAAAAVETLETRRLLVGTVTGTVFNDLNGNGIQDGGEGGVENFRIYIDANDNNQFDDGSEDFIFTPQNGEWEWGNLTAGNYTIRVDPGSANEVTTPVGGEYAVTVVDDTTVSGRNFGVRTIVGAVRGTVFLDTNGNGTKDVGEEFAENFQVYVDADSSGTLNAGDVVNFTNAQGQWQFEDLVPGQHTIRIEQGDAYDVTAPALGFYTVTVLANQDETIGSFGVTESDNPNPDTGVISGTVTNAATSNGVQGVVVYIDANNNDSLDNGEVSTATAANGTYSFGSLAAGTYTIRVEGTVNYTVATPLSGEYSRVLAQGATSADNDFTLTVTNPQPQFVHNDFNGDGKADLYFRNSATGVNTVWFMDGKTRLSTGTLPSLAGADWVIGASGDFNGDGKTDLVWHNNATGASTIWLMDGVTRTSSVALQTANSAWRVYGAGDFDRDGNTDIVFRNTTTGSATIWYMDGSALRANNQFGVLPQVVTQNWQIAGVGDFDNDGDADIIWTNATTKQNSLWLMDNRAVQNDGFRGIRFPTAAGWRLAKVADLDNDGDPDLLWANNNTGANNAWILGNVINRPVAVTFGTLTLPAGTTIPA